MHVLIFPETFSSIFKVTFSGTLQNSYFCMKESEILNEMMSRVRLEKCGKNINAEQSKSGIF